MPLDSEFDQKYKVDRSVNRLESLQQPKLDQLQDFLIQITSVFDIADRVSNSRQIYRELVRQYFRCDPLDFDEDFPLEKSDVKSKIVEDQRSKLFYSSVSIFSSILTDFDEVF